MEWVGAAAFVVGLVYFGDRWLSRGLDEDFGEENADEESAGRVGPGRRDVDVLPRDRRGGVVR